MSEGKTALWHAERASRFLSAIEEAQEETRKRTANERLQMAVSGETKQLNRDMEWTVQCAQAHALTALALKTTRA